MRFCDDDDDFCVIFVVFCRPSTRFTQIDKNFQPLPGLIVTVTAAPLATIDAAVVLAGRLYEVRGVFLYASSCSSSSSSTSILLFVFVM